MKREKPLNRDEKAELATLWRKAGAAAEKKGQKLAPQWITDMGERAALEELRKEHGEPVKNLAYRR